MRYSLSPQPTPPPQPPLNASPSPLTVSPQPPQEQMQQQPLATYSKEKMQNFSDLAKSTPPFKDYLNNLQTYAYLQNIDGDTMMMMQQPRTSQITQQHSSSTDEGCETDHGGELKGNSLKKQLQTRNDVKFSKKNCCIFIFFKISPRPSRAFD